MIFFLLAFITKYLHVECECLSGSDFYQQEEQPSEHQGRHICKTIVRGYRARSEGRSQSRSLLLFGTCCPLPLCWRNSYKRNSSNRVCDSYIYVLMKILRNFYDLSLSRLCRSASGRNTSGKVVHQVGWIRWLAELSLSTWLCRWCWLGSSLPSLPSRRGAATLGNAHSAAQAWDTRTTTMSCLWSPWTSGGGTTTTVTNLNSASTAPQPIQVLRSHQPGEAQEIHRHLTKRP